MSSKIAFRVRHLTVAATLTGLFTAATVPPALAAPPANGIDALAAKVSLERWHAAIKHLPPPTEGCFHAAYPSIVWKKSPVDRGRPIALPQGGSAYTPQMG